MTHDEPSHAAITVFDPAMANGRTTRGMLRELGYASVEVVSEFKALANLVARGGLDLLIAELDAPDGDIGGLVRRLRGGEAGPNPFIGVILTTWRGDEGLVAAAINTGADDVFLRPFSRVALQERLNAIVRARKPFVVTSDYIGPDRRKDPSRPGSAPAFTPPNTFKAAVEGDLAALHAAEADIAQARAALDQERVKRLALRVAAAARGALEAAEVVGPDEAETIDRAARELRRRLRVCARGEAVRLASALTDATADLIEAAGRADAKKFALVRDLALGAYAAFAGEVAAESTSGELDQILGRLKSRSAAVA